jgi:hypothetical protein
MAVPGVPPVTHPDDPSESEIVATGGVPETAGGEIATHVAEFEMSCVVPSARVAVAINCDAVPCAMLRVLGLTMGVAGPAAIDFTAWTLITAFVVIVPNFAVTVADPAATPVTSPVGSTVAKEPLDGVTLHAVARLMF